jgi:Staphylococcus phage HNH endonuclease
MVSDAPDVTGRRYGRLIAIMRVKAPRTSWLCRCDCGVEKVVRYSKLKRGQLSCGCLRRPHGMSYSPEYKSWISMLSRCRSTKGRDWKNYGSRGIAVCEEWQHSFQAFLAHVGLRPTAKHSIDRINNDGNYEPGNVRWATADVQANNRRNGALRKYVTLDGEHINRRIIAERLALPFRMYRWLIYRYGGARW